MHEEFDPEEAQGFSVKREVYDWVEAGLTAVLCVILLFTFVGRTIGVDGSSMVPTLHDQDRLICSRLFYKAEYGDIVVVTKPNSRNEPLIKRVIATGGQTVDIDFDAGIVYVDGEALDEPYIAEPTHISFELSFPRTVPEGHVFIMGDNRNASWDSRAAEVGMVDERYILGKVVYRVLPLDSIGVPK